jgi:hypothetical protein
MPGVFFIKVGEESFPSALTAVDVRKDFSQIAFAPLAFGVVFHIADVPAYGNHVPRGVEEQDIRGFAIPSGAPRLLIVRLKASREVSVENPANVGLVDSHTERDRRNDHRNLVVDKLPLAPTADLRGETRVI